MDPRTPPPAPHPAVPARLRTLGWLLDELIPIPGTGRRVGLDAVAGLAPGIGDALTSVLSAYIVVEAARMGVARPVLARMVGNVALDTVVGSVPFLGDLFDAGWKSNSRNLALLHAEMERPGSERRSSTLVVAGVVVALLLVLAGLGTLAFLVARAIWGAVAGAF